MQSQKTMGNIGEMHNFSTSRCKLQLSHQILVFLCFDECDKNLDKQLSTLAKLFLNKVAENLLSQGFKKISKITPRI